VSNIHKSVGDDGFNEDAVAKSLLMNGWMICHNCGYF